MRTSVLQRPANRQTDRQTPRVNTATETHDQRDSDPDFRCYIDHKKVKVKERIALCAEIHDRATERHLPYGITQCYLPPDTGERAPP